MLAIFLLLFCWGLFAIGIGLLAIAVAFALDEAWRQIGLAVDRKDD